MKIACESCGAKYSIADEKVGGKVFKIRCKRCSEVIVVRGDQQAAPAQAIATGGEAIWHVVIDGDQAGPYAPAQLAEMLTSGAVDWEAYVWTEGFDNWVPMRDVPDLVAQITSGGQSASDGRASEYDVGGDAFAAQPSMGADPFADDGPTTFQPSTRNEPDLFAAASREAASPFDGGGHVVSSASSPRAAAAAAATGPAMTGARNENSVLFSLKNLQALATSPATSGGGGPSSVSSAPGQARAGIAGGEGSGLIDIRALASATGVGDAEKQGAKDELLSLGTQSAFGALGSPMLAPAAAEERSGSKALIWAGVAGVAFLSVAVVAVAYIMRPQAAAPVAAVGTAPAATAVGAAAGPNGAQPAAQQEQDEEDGDKPTEGELAAKAAAEQNAKTEDTRRAASSAPAKKPSGGSSTSDSKPSAPAEEPKAAAPAPAKPSGPRTIDDLLDGALGGGSKPAKAKVAATEPPKSNLPDLPSRDDVVSAMSSVKDAVSACAQGQSGVAFVNVSVAGATGRVTSAEVTGITGPAGSCIAKAVRNARFPKFQQSVFKVKYPFKL